MFIYSGGFWYLYQGQYSQERHKRDSQPRYREQARVKTPELREVRSECLQSAVCSVWCAVSVCSQTDRPASRPSPA